MKKRILFAVQLALLFVFSVSKGNGMHMIETLYKIIPVSSFDKENLENCTKPLPLDVNSGFIHFSFKHQVDNVLQKFFSDFEQIIILEIDLQILQKNGSELRVEVNKPGGEKYPHLYGAQKIPLAAVKKVIVLKKDGAGVWEKF